MSHVRRSNLPAPIARSSTFRGQECRDEQLQQSELGLQRAISKTLTNPRKNDDMAVLSFSHLGQSSSNDVYSGVEIRFELVFDKRQCAVRLAKLFDGADDGCERQRNVCDISKKKKLECTFTSAV